MRETGSKKKKNRIWIVLIPVIAILLFFTGVRLYFRLPVRDFYKDSRKAFVIPDTNYGFVAQGMCRDEETGLFFLTGYMSNHMASPIYVLDPEDPGKYKVVRMHLEDSMNNSDNMCHAGGIAVWKDFVYVAGCQDRCVYVYRKSDILSAEDGDGVNALGRHMTYVSEKDYLNVDFATVYDGRIYLGEFYREENYPTLEKHHIVTEAGEENKALILGFTLSEECEYGIPQYPDVGYSIPGLVQGAAFSEDRVYLSTSYGLADSHLLTYADDLKDEDDLPFEYLRFLDKGARIFQLDSSCLISDTLLPPMAEEIEPFSGELYIQCESASNKYIFGKFTGGKYCYALDLSSVER